MKIITTVGTSLLSNLFDGNKEIKNIYDRYENERLANWESKKMEEIFVFLKKLLGGKCNDITISAEVTSIIKILDLYPLKQNEVQLISTDTVLSRICAELILWIFEERKEGTIIEYSSKSDCIKGLQVNDAKEFERDGIMNMITMFYEKGYVNQQNGDEYVFNITGGYKALIPFMTIYAQVNNIPMYYIFEKTDKLLKIPKTPIIFDYGIFARYSHIFNILEKEGTTQWSNIVKEHQIRQGILDDYLWIDEDYADLNAIGRICWDKFKEYFQVKISYESNYLKEEPTLKGEIERAITELDKRIKAHGKPFDQIKDEDIKHIKIDNNDNVFIFKSTNEKQIRILYRYTDNGNSDEGEMIVYSYKQAHVSGKYWEVFENEYPRLKNSETYPLTLKRK